MIYRKRERKKKKKASPIIYLSLLYGYYKKSKFDD